MKRLRQSFRFRILALTIIVCGTVLVAFGFGSRYALYLIKISTVDQGLRTLPFQGFPHPDHQQSWIRFSDATDRVGGRILGGDVHIVAYGPDAEVYFQSEFWPGKRLASMLPPPEGELQAPPGPELERDPSPWIRDPRRGGGLPLGFDSGENGQVTEGRPPLIGDGGRRGALRGVRPMGPPTLLTLGSPAGPIRFGVFQFSGYNVAMGVELSQVAQEMAHVRNAFLFSAPLALLVIAFGSWIIASRAISPIRKLTSATRGLSAKNLNDRIEEGAEDREFSELIQVFNDMLERLERSFNQATRFSADAAHELKTPLTILQGHLESALQEAPDDSEQQRRLGMLLEETQRLHGITRRLLLLAQADAGQIKVKGESIRIRDLLAEMVEDFEMQAPQTRYTLSKGEEVTVSLDRSLVTQILQNLLSNAVKYNDETDPWVKIDYEIVGSELKIDISNGGDGISESAQARLFERFSRVDSARNRGVDGFGLGLNLSREFARAQGGELSLAESSPGMTRFRLTLPIDS